MKKSIARVLRRLANRIDGTTEIGRIREFVTCGDFASVSFDFHRDPASDDRPWWRRLLHRFGR